MHMQPQPVLLLFVAQQTRPKLLLVLIYFGIVVVLVRPGQIDTRRTLDATEVTMQQLKKSSRLLVLLLTS